MCVGNDHHPCLLCKLGLRFDHEDDSRARTDGSWWLCSFACLAVPVPTCVAWIDNGAMDPTWRLLQLGGAGKKERERGKKRERERDRAGRIVPVRGVGSACGAI